MLPELVLRLIEYGEVVRAWPSNDYWLELDSTIVTRLRWRSSCA